MIAKVPLTPMKFYFESIRFDPDMLSDFFCQEVLRKFLTFLTSSSWQKDALQNHFDQ